VSEGLSVPSLQGSQRFDSPDLHKTWVSVPRVLNEVLEHIKVVINQTFALKVGGGFQGIDSSGFNIKEEEVFSKFFFKVEPVDETKMTGLRFVFKFVHCPAVSTSCFYIQHCPHDLHFIVIEGFGT